MTDDEIRNGMREAQHIMQRADLLAEQALNFAIGRLRRLDVTADTLRDLKRELRNFDITTGKWK